MSKRPARGLAFFAATGVSGLIALVGVNALADKAKTHPALHGVATLRDYITRRNG